MVLLYSMIVLCIVTFAMPFMYVKSLVTVIDFKQTKILSRKACVPNRDGDSANDLIDFNIIFSAQMDVEILLHEFRAGRLLPSTPVEREKLQKLEEEENEKDI